MSRYALNKVLWQIARDESACGAFLSNRSDFLAGRELTSDERDLLREMDFRRLFQAGAHPFLLYTARIRIVGGWTFQLMVDHIQALEGLSPPLDIAT